jgi:hypothetical protein
METIPVKCIITRYDEKIKTPPFLTLKVDEVLVNQPHPKTDYLGQKFANLLKETCLSKGHIFKFYSSSEDKSFDYEIVIK